MSPCLFKRLRRALFALWFAATLTTSAAEQIKVGIIGLDAHAVPWTQIINDPRAQPPISGMRVVAAVPASSADIPFSADNIEKNTARMRELGVEICSSIDEVVSKADAVMVLSIDGRPHLEQARAAFAAKKPVFIDKPIAASLVEAMEIFRAAEASGVPCFTSSALRCGPTVAGMATDPKLGRVLGCDTYCSNKSILPAHPDFFYYGIHGCEMLFTIMGSGCESVTRFKTHAADLAIGVWKGGRLGTFRGILEGQVGYGASVFGEKAITRVEKFEGYEPLLIEIASFFKTGLAPVTAEQTLEIYAFMEAADESLRQGGKPVSIKSTLEKAQEQLNTRASFKNKALE